MDTAKQAWFPPRDDASVKYIKDRLKQLEAYHLLLGQGVDAMRQLLEASIRVENELLLALRDGTYQMPLDLK